MDSTKTKHDRALIDRTWYKRPADMPESISCGGAIVRQQQSTVYVALVKEGGVADYILPKGRIKSGESLEEAARREIEEEAGLFELTLVGKLGVCQRLNYARKRWVRTHYFLFLTRQINGIPTDKKHDYELCWFPIDELPGIFWPEQEDLIQANRERILRIFQ